jgi:hypothetical protein
MDRFRFQNADLQNSLRRLYATAGLPYEAGSDGSLQCDDAFAPSAEALRSAVRSQRFACWQTHCVLDDPENDQGEYRQAVLTHLAERAIPFELEEHNGECWLLLPEDEILPDSLWESVHGSVTTYTRENPVCCFCRGSIEEASFGEISVRRPDGGFRSVLYTHLECLRGRVHPEAIHILETSD